MDRIGLLLLSGILFILALAFAGCDAGDTAPPGADYRVYTRSSQGYSIRYPRTWSLEPNVQGYSVLGTGPLVGVGDTYQEQVGVVVVPLDYPPPSLELYYLRNVVALTEQLSNFQMVSNADIIIDGVNAKRLHFRYTDGGLALECYEVIVVSERRAYVTIATTRQSEYAAQRDLLRELAHSFRLTTRSAGDTPGSRGTTAVADGPAAAAVRAGAAQ